MKEFFAGCLEGFKRHRRRNLAVLFAAVFFLSGAAGLGFTGEKAQMRKVHRIKEEDIRVKNIGCETKELNPLRRDEHPEINKVVAEYFEGLTEGETFVEKYDDLHVYTKVGEYYGTYIAFAAYRMKIKDIYTKVPGLVTLYATRDEKSGEYRVDTNAPKGQEEGYAGRITAHADVQELIGQTEKKFDLALRSDAILREALSELKDAYSAYTG